jgi:cyclic pyranopterin phosphate synthase
MPEEGIALLDHSEILSFDEIIDVVIESVNLGIDKVRITGGEPLVRKGIVSLVKMIASVQGIKDLSMTTNGVLLKNFAKDLKNAGLQRINISLDTLNEYKYNEITRIGKLSDVLSGIEAAIEAGLKPLKINCVVNNSSDEEDALQVKDFCNKKGLNIRFIHKMDLSKGEFSVVEGGEGGDCSICNRLRLTSNGLIKPCLFTDIEYSVRKYGAKQALLKALENKPSCGSINNTGQFYNIGG